MHLPRIPFIECLSKDEIPEQVRPTFELENQKLKAIVLNDRLTVTEKDATTADLDIDYKPEQLEEVLSKKCIEFIDKLEGIYRLHRLVFDYSFWKAEEILRSVLPEELQDDVPSSFTKTGHLAHLNLKDEYKAYDSIIGQVILDKNPSITTVVDKVDSIETKYRTFKMKVIAGEPNFMVTQRESDCEFTFDFSKVYWNSRLSTEHGRLIDGFTKGSAICDAMAGVGPFVIPAGKKGCIAFANDLNPDSYEYLKENIVKNKVRNVVFPYNLDGAEFIKNSPKLLMDFAKKHNSTKLTIHANGHAKRRKVIKKLTDYQLPIIHVYHFEKFSPTEVPEPTDDDLHRRVHEKLIHYLNYDIKFEELSFHTVRKVAPTKPMFCVSFRLPEEVAFAQ
ncbi:hypothetical protein FOA43_004166 [Brettanomyces nanus]|uniref:tRNA (guanine(37)-N1)-methyltransferase n=1 Tax=Eeniella nana TaxID=13502 RepID=A0A875SAF7_EENNA|nr:uncharacterized protein FOA43_004166 [Brettanomyces nanus]QPG76772.1 hypothetical protein FOA43_004166 [Brettanomyces nanus]